MADSQPDTGDDTTPDQPTGADTAPDLAAEVEKWKTQSRRHEDRAKANAKAAKELEDLKRSSMTEMEQAIANARAEAATEAAKTYGGRLVDAEVRAATAGRNLDVDALLDGLDRTRFLTDDGDPDRDAITAWVDRIAPQPDEPADPARPFVVDIGQGTRGDAPALNSDPLLKDLKSKLGVR